MKIIVTGGAGFIGSAVIRHLISDTDHEVVNLDALTYAGNLDSLVSASESSRYEFIKADICDEEAIKKVFTDQQPDAIMHLAAESHVDRSIDGPKQFIETNVMGTFNLLHTARHYYETLEGSKKEVFRFHHISTDEVYGDLPDDPSVMFTEDTSYEPSSPYSASKAASDHLVRAWGRTYGLPTVVTNCSNNYGPYHFPEKLVPHVILNALAGKELPVYGDGLQIRDWLYVEDHARALVSVLEKGGIGETYNIGGHNEKKNIDVVHAICDLLEELSSEYKLENVGCYRDLITFVADRPGHDLRYAIDASKIERDLGWTPAETFESGMRKTVQWYLENQVWWEGVLDGSYKLERIGE